MAYHQQEPKFINNQLVAPRAFNYQPFESPKHLNAFKVKQTYQSRYRMHEQPKVSGRQRYQSVNQKSKMEQIRGHSLLGNNLTKSKELIERANVSLLKHNKQNQTIFEEERLQNLNDQNQNGFSRRSSSQSIGLYRQKYGNKSWIVDQVTKIQQEAIGKRSPRRKKWTTKISDTNQISVAQTIKSILVQYQDIYWQPTLPPQFLQNQQFPNRLKDHINQNRHIVIGILTHYHRTMKLPIEALFIAINIFDRFIQKKATQNITQFQLSSLIDLDSVLRQWNSGIFHLRETATLGIVCLYMSHKIEKYKVYHINSWMKHLTATNVPLLPLALPELCQQESNNAESIQQSKSQLLKRILLLEGEIFCTLNFNLWKPTLYEIVMQLFAIFNNTSFLSIFFGQTNEIKKNNLQIKQNRSSQERLKFIEQEQFYFCQFLVEISIFCNYNSEHQKNINGWHSIKMIDIALSVIYLSFHFFKGKNSRNLIKDLVEKFYQEKMQTQQILEQKLNHIKKLGNKLFKLLIDQKPVYMSAIVEKYAKSHNHFISKLIFKKKNFSNSDINLLNINSKNSENISPRGIYSIHNRSQFSNISSSETDLLMIQSNS